MAGNHNSGGRNRLPMSAHILRGTFRKDRHNADEPRPGELSTDCPDELSDALSKGEWKRTIVPAIECGHITSADRAFAIAHCELWATWQSQLQEATKHPHVVAVGPHRYPRPNPARSVANQTLLILAKVDAELGLTPVSRSRVRVKKSARTLSDVEKFKAEKRLRKL
jgi:P27 family predicted phage terminase small subunit